ncbi:MAG: hypothetical protein ABI454_08865 [Sphingomicrobium sp.]
MARPSDYTPDLAEVICSRLENGESLKSICEDAAMPHKRSVLRWVKSHEDFAEEYHLARWAAAEVFDDEARQLISGIKDRETAIAARAKFEILRWRAGVHAPRVYGERLDVGVGVTVDLTSLLDRRRQRVLEANERLGIAGGDEEP